MHKETLKSMELGQAASMIVAGVLVISLVFMIGLSNLLYNRFAIPYISYVVFLLYVAVGIYIYRKKILEYRYSIIDDELIFEQIVGKRNKPLIDIRLSNALYFCPINQEKPMGVKVDKNYFLLFKKKSPKAYVLVIKEKGQICRIVFQPSEKLVELIKKKIV